MNINWYPGHMAKAKREIIDSLKLVDVAIEIVDSRIPKSSRNPEIDNIIGTKPRIILFNKSDLADENKTKAWINYFAGIGIPAIATNSNTGKGLGQITDKITNVMRGKIQSSFNKGRTNATIRAVILGIPNVGKSSLINKISGKNSQEIGNKPGVTKKKQWIRLKNNIELLDTPGILWPKFETEEVALNLSFVGTIKDEIIDTEEIGIKLLGELKRKYPKELITRYKLKEENILLQDYDLIELIGKKRGCLLQGGVIDIFKTSNMILDEFRQGKIGRITLEMWN